MRTSVNEEHTPFLSLSQILFEPLKVQPNTLLVVIPIKHRFDPYVLEDRWVVGPGRVGDVDLLLGGGEGIELG